jgi:hypothetical protein
MHPPPSNPCGQAIKPADAETAEEAMDRAYLRYSGTAKAEWLPPEVTEAATDKAVNAAAGVIAVGEISTSHRAKCTENEQKRT